jgi:hypothetical protein
VITATTYDETSNIVLHEEIISVRVKIEEGPWWAALDDLWHAMTNFATTTAGLITTIGGAVAVIAGGVRWIRRTRNKKAQPKPEGGMPSDAGAESSAREEAPPEATGSPET